MIPFFAYGPRCPNCQHDQGFVMSGEPILTQQFSKAVREAMRTNDWESILESDMEYDPESPELDIVMVPFKCPRCGSAFALDIMMDDEGRIVMQVEWADPRLTGDEIVSWLDPPPRA
jgi:hypothetical protein